MQIINTDLAFPNDVAQTAYTVKVFVSSTADWTCINWGTIDDAFGTIGGFAAMLGIWALLFNSFYSDFRLHKATA